MANNIEGANTMTDPEALNILLVGDSGVGKTALAHRMVENVFVSRTKNTVGVSYLTKAVEIDGSPVRVQVWDTAGQVNFTKLCFI